MALPPSFPLSINVLVWFWSRQSRFEVCHLSLALLKLKFQCIAMFYSLWGWCWRWWWWCKWKICKVTGCLIGCVAHIYRVCEVLMIYASLSGSPILSSSLVIVFSFFVFFLYLCDLIVPVFQNDFWHVVEMDHPRWISVFSVTRRSRSDVVHWVTHG